MMRKKGFTLIELVMVIVILGILAAVAIPTFFNLQDQAKVSAAQGALGGLRSGISIWYAKEAASNGVATYPTLSQLTNSTNGVMANGIIPNNPYTGKNIIKAGTSADGDTTVGWIYDASTGKIFGTGGASAF